MKHTKKAQPTGRGRAVDGSGDAGSVLSYLDNTTRAAPCQVAPDGGVSFRSVGDFATVGGFVARPRQSVGYGVR